MLPDTVVRLLQRLERLSGRVPIGRAVAIIIGVGLSLTLLAASAVWWAERTRAHEAFLAAAARIQGLMQDRMDHQAALVRQMADWAAYQSFDGDTSAGWSSGGVLLLGPDALLQTDLLPRLITADPAQAVALQRCLLQLDSLHTRGLCRATSQSGQDEAWYLVEKVHQPGTGWVLMPFKRTDLEAQLDDGLYWLVSARLARAVGAPRGVRHAPRPGDEARAEVAERLDGERVRVADVDLALQVMGRPRPQRWAEVWARQMPMALALVAGLLFTLGGVHVYLMLVSTRRRAQATAGDMSAALQRTQSRNQAVMDTAPDAIVMTDASGVVQWCNQATTSIFGRTQDDLRGQPVSAILPVLGTCPVDAWFAQHGFSDRVIGFETTGVRNEGTAFPVALSASRVRLDGELIQTFIVRDTTDAKWAEQELLLRDRALASSADGVIITSMTLPNQPVIYVNRAFERITGYEAHEMLGMNCKLLQGQDVDQPAIATMRRAIRKGEACQVVLRNYRKDGSLFYNELAISPVLSPDGVLTHYVGVQNDITDRIAAEQVLHLRTERLNAVFELSPDGFVVLDKRGEVSIVNPAFERMTGLAAVDLVGHTQAALEEVLMARCTATDIEGLSAVAAIAGASTEGEAGAGGIMRLLHLHTPTVRTLVQRVRQGAHDNETVMYFRDITHELEVDRMKSEFLAMAAHELRTPMVSIFGFTELLLKRPFSDERRQDMLGTIHKQASILINLVNELLDLARIEARRGKDFNRCRQPIGPIIAQVLAGLNVPGDTRKVQVQAVLPDVWVWADADKLGQAVLNVLSNAYKYSPQGGDITLAVRFEAAAQRLCIEVQDHGIGMSPEHVARVFERFFRADPSGNIPGTGLGMSLVKEIMGLHQGEVALDSEVGQGTTVRLYLPACPAPAAVPPDPRGIGLEPKVSTD